MRFVLIATALAGCGRVRFEDGRTGRWPDASTSSDGTAPHWTLVQTVAGTAPTLSIASSRAGDLIVVAVQTNTTPVSAIADDANNTYVPIPQAQASEPSPADNLEIWYVASSLASASTISITTPSIVATSIWEVAGIRMTNPLDGAAELSAQSATTTPLGPPIVTTAPGDFVVSVAVVANGVSDVIAGNEFTNDHKTRGNGWAHLTDPAAPAGMHQAAWNQGTSGTYCANAAAFFVAP